MKKFTIIVLLFLLSSVAAQAQMAMEPLDLFPHATLSIYTPDMRRHDFKIWIADSEARREQGLMFVKSLPADQGMLFIFNAPQPVSMWMKNTLIPLDMVFIDPDGRIESIVANTTPMSEKLINSKAAVATVLELKGGRTEKLNIHAGAVIRVTN